MEIPRTAGLVAVLREIGHPEVGEQHADVEGHRAVEGEFGIDDAGLGVGDHDRAGMQVAVQQRLGIGGKQMLHALRLDLEVAVGAQLGDDAVELRAGVAVHRRFEIGIGEDQVLGDVAQFDIVGEQRKVGLAVARRHGEVGAAEQRARHEHAEVLGDARQLAAGDQRLPQDHVGRQELHDDERLGLVEMQDLRHHAGRPRLLPGQRVVFEEGALERQRPAVADEPHIGQRLLDHDRARRTLDDEDEVEVAVADLAHLPGRAVGADRGGKRADTAEPDRQGLDRQRLERILMRRHARPPDPRPLLRVYHDGAKLVSPLSNVNRVDI